MTSDTHELVLRIAPSLPADFALRDARDRQLAVDGLKNLLQVRRNLIELRAGQDTQEGLAQQYAAEASAVMDRLCRDARTADDLQRLSAHRREHLSGRYKVYRAKAERARALVVQYQLEIDLYRDMLTAGAGAPNEEG